MIIYFIIEDLLKHYLQKKFHILWTPAPQGAALRRRREEDENEDERQDWKKNLEFGFHHEYSFVVMVWL